MNELVTLGMVDGKELVGSIDTFAPEVPDLLLLPAPSVAVSEDEKKERVRVPVERVAFLAFHNTSLMHSPLQVESPQQIKIYLSGGRTFSIYAEKECIDCTLGFFARPDAVSPYRKFYFYNNGINARERVELIGSMLLAEGALEINELSHGIITQDSERKVPIGQIIAQQKNIDLSIIEDAQKKQSRMRLRIGEVLVEQGLISNEDVEHALSEQKRRRGKRLGEVLVELGIVTEVALFKTLARKFHIPFVDLEEVKIDESVFETFSNDFIEKYRFFPLEIIKDRVVIAISDPLNFDTLDAIRFMMKRHIQEVLVVPSQLKQFINARLTEEKESDKPHEALSDLLSELEEECALVSDGDDEDELALDSDAIVVRLVNQIIADGYKKGASDIHIEPNGKRNKVLVRYRIDGACEIYEQIPAAFRNNLTTRIKIMANLDIAERRKPQDGKLKFKVGDKNIELRVATMPTVNSNEDVVMRILAASKPIPIEKIGMNERNLREFLSIIKKPYGLILCVGPTGSGKTTTLHSAIGHINKIDRKIWTAEDPVEITQKGLRQVQVHPTIGFDFAAAMRGFLRLDPDVIMIGEMRDLETSSIGVEASLTGHLVLSTLHTNSAPETITRLLDMGLDPFTFGDAILGVLAQRLARSLCKTCRESNPATEEEYEMILKYYGETALKKNLGILTREDLHLWHAEGCPACDNKGYKGRLALHELLVSTDDICHAVQHKQRASDIRELAIKGGMTTLFQDGVEKAIAGKTDLKQVMAVCLK